MLDLTAHSLTDCAHLTRGGEGQVWRYRQSMLVMLFVTANVDIAKVINGVNSINYRKTHAASPSTKLPSFPK